MFWDFFLIFTTLIKLFFQDFNAQLLELFTKFDLNDDGVLSFEEFKSVYLPTNNKPMPNLDPKENSEDIESYKSDKNIYDEIIDLKAKMYSLNLTTMSQSKENKYFGTTKVRI